MLTKCTEIDDIAYKERGMKAAKSPYIGENIPYFDTRRWNPAGSIDLGKSKTLPSRGQRFGPGGKGRRRDALMEGLSSKMKQRAPRAHR